jgi:hypothetical protein
MCEYNEIANGTGYGTMNLADLFGPLMTARSGGLLLVGLLTAVIVWLVGVERLVRLPLVVVKRLIAVRSPGRQARWPAPN